MADNTKGNNTLRTGSHQGISFKPSVKKTMAEPIENYNEKIHRAIEMFRQVSPKSNCTVTTKLEDLRKVFTKDRDQNLRIKSVEKQKAKKIQINRDVPACLHKYLDDGNIESFQVLKENPNFLLKTLTVCQECYLKITEFSEEAGAVGGSKIVQGGIPNKFRINEAISQYQKML